MNTTCSVGAIELFRIAIVAVTYTSSQKRKKQITLDWISPSIVNEDIDEFRSRIGLMLKAEVSEYLSLANGAVPNWNDFDLQRSIVFPEIFKDEVFQYGGSGEIYKYDIFQVRAYLNAVKSTKLDDYVKTINKYNLTSTLSVDECQILKIEYPNGFVLEMNREQREVKWYRNGELERELHFREGESPKGLLTALEDYSTTGSVDEGYGMFMIDPFNLDMDHVSLNQRGRLFLNDLGV